MKTPRITIITPSLNHGVYLEQTICSVLDQKYHNLEFMVVDGGSTDNSAEIIKKYERHLAWWTTEKDGGQSHAINKGFARATGEIINWLCSDDQLEPGALGTIAHYFTEDPSLDVLVGTSRAAFPKATRTLRAPRPEELRLIPWTNMVSQPSCFHRRRALDRSPALDEALHYLMDLELWAFFRSKGAKWKVIDEVLSTCLYHEDNKTLVGGAKAIREAEAIQQRYVPRSMFAVNVIGTIGVPLMVARHQCKSWITQKSMTAAILAVREALGCIYGRNEVKAKLRQYSFFLAN